MRRRALLLALALSAPNLIGCARVPASERDAGRQDTTAGTADCGCRMTRAKRRDSERERSRDEDE